METVRLDREIHHTTAANGVVVLSERVAHVRSAAVGVWVRTLVLEEISTVEDTPDDLVFELLASTLWPEHPYGFSILGTRDTVGALSADDLKQLHGQAYFPGNCVIAAAGNLTHEGLLEELGRQGWYERAAGDGRPEAPREPAIPPAVRGGEARHAKDTAQTHVVFLSDTVAYA